jgi:hypothetical protein
MPTHTTDVANVIRPYKGRDPFSATTVFVYRNLHRAVWSLIANDGPDKGKVVGHADHVVLDHARWRVNKLGRARAVATGQRNVHAGVIGILADTQPTDVDWERVSYNPFRTNHFHLADMVDSVVDSTRYAMFGIDGKAYAA